MKKILFCMTALLIALSACGNSDSQSKNPDKEKGDKENSDEMNTENLSKDPAKVLIHTTEGDITVLLYGDTPLHRDNFLKLVKENFYDSTLFHRVIDGFMIQAGDLQSKTAKPGQQLGAGDPGYTLPAEINYPNHYHKRGALAAARTGDDINPERRSSGSQFYIVTGEVATPESLQQTEQHMIMAEAQKYFNELAQQNMAKIRQMQSAGDRDGLMALQEQLATQAEQMAEKTAPKMPDSLKQVYTTVGGTPFLDGQYTVFGEVLDGMDVVDKIGKAQTGAGDRPVKDIRILSAEILPAK